MIAQVRTFVLAIALAIALVTVAGCGSKTDGGAEESQSESEKVGAKATTAFARADSLIRQAYEQIQSGDIAAADASLTDAATAADQVENPATHAALFTRIAEGHAKRGNKAAAIESLDKAIRAGAKIPTRRTRWRTFARSPAHRARRSSSPAKPRPR